MSHAEDYYANFGGLSVEEFVNRYMRSSEQEINRINQTIDFLPGDISSVLDVGAGFGILLEELQGRRSIKGVGIEITDAKIGYAQKRGVDMRKGDASKLDFPDNSFDLVVSCEVLEHLPFGVFEKTLSEFTRVSRKYIVVSVPFDENRVFVKCPYCGATANPNYHMREFDENSMSGLFSNAKLERTALIGQVVTTPLQKWLSRQKRMTWPPFLVCPSCSYREANGVVNNAKENVLNDNIGSPTRNFLKEKASRLLALTSTYKPQWILGLYSIVSSTQSTLQ